jgi:hypothetical protein
MSDIDEHYKEVIQSIEDGELIFFLGAGANQCDRIPQTPWYPASGFLPNARELAAFLADSSNIPDALRKMPCPECGRIPPLLDEQNSLSKIAEYITIKEDVPKLYNKLHKVFDKDRSATSLHEFMAEIPAIMRERDSPHPNQIIVTTNYDDLIEKAFNEKGQDVDVLSYMIPTGTSKCEFMHRLPNGEIRPIKPANEYTEVSPEKRPVIVKIHGAIDRKDKSRDSYVISERDYLEYLAGPDISSLIPINILSKLRNSSFLFLGYSLNDWNMRVFLHKIFESQRLKYSSWSIQRDADPYTVKYWKTENIEVINMDLGSYVQGFRSRMREASKEAV